MIRQNPDGTNTPLTLRNHKLIKGSTLKSICTQSGISRDDFIAAYEPNPTPRINLPPKNRRPQRTKTIHPAKSLYWRTHRRHR